MATTKQKLTEDFTEQPQAQTAEDVNNQDSRTRLWQSLDYSYGQERKQSDKQFDQAKLNADNQLLNRGMQRSSYGAATLANLDKQKIEASNDIYNRQIADYQSRIGQIEQQEKEDERWERQYADSRADTAWNQAFQQNQFNYQKEQAQKQFDYQQSRDAITDAFNEKQFNANREDTAWNQAFQQKQFDAQQAQWKEQFDYNKMTANQQIAYNYLMNMLEAGDNPSDELLKQAGISRKDYEQMKATAVKSSGGGGKKTTNPAVTNGQDTTNNFLSGLDSWFANWNTQQTQTNTGNAGASTLNTNTSASRGNDATTLPTGSQNKEVRKLFEKNKPNIDGRG